MANELTAERLRELLAYDPATGVFTWRQDRRSARAGSVAGNSRDDGQTRIQVEGRRYYAKALAHLYVYGDWPTPGSREKAKAEKARAGRPARKVKAKKKSAHGYKGNKPTGEGWRYQGTVQDEGLSWLVYVRDQPPPSPWVTVKVFASGRAPTKANYWWAVNLDTMQIGYAKTKAMLSKNRPIVAAGVENILGWL